MSYSFIVVNDGEIVIFFSKVKCLYFVVCSEENFWGEGEGGSYGVLGYLDFWGWRGFGV